MDLLWYSKVVNNAYWLKELHGLVRVKLNYILIGYMMYLTISQWSQ